MKEYLTAGVIQFRVKANSPEEAIQKAEKRADTLMKSGSLIIGIDCDQVEETATGIYVDVEAATQS